MKKSIAKKLKKCLPPGTDMKKEIYGISLGLIAAIAYSFAFLWRYVEARNELYVWHYGSSGGVKMLQEGAVMPAFYVLLQDTLDGFGVYFICMAGLVLWHYLSHYQESKSIYLMRRLPDKWELHRRCATVPLNAIVIAVLVRTALILIYYGIYLFFTPQQCLLL